MRFRTLSDFLQSESLGLLDNLNFPAKGDVCHSGNLGISAQALWVSAKFLKNSKPILIITKEQKSVDLWHENLCLQIDECDLLSLPLTKETDKTRVFSGILEEKLKFIQNAAAGSKIVIASAEALKTKLPSAKRLKEKSLNLKVGDILSEENLQEIFISRGFKEQPVVEGVGDFSIRGCIIDINPLLREHPIRMELWGNTLESIRTCDIFTQRSWKI